MIKLLNRVTLSVPFLVAVGLLSTSPARAQMPGAGPGAGMSAALAKLFGDVKAFSAKAQVQVSEGDKQVMKMPMNFSMLDDKMRVEMDMTQVDNSSAPPGMVDQLKQMGMAQVISIVRPDKKQAYVIYPERKTVLAMPMPAETSKDAKFQKTPLGKETVDGHPCVKQKWTIPDEKGGTVEPITWNATDLKDFPIRIETKDKGNTSTITFSNVQLTRPDARLFEPPGSYKQYNSPQEMMQGLMQGGQEATGKK